MNARIKLPLIIAWSLLLPGCATPSQGFSDTTLTFAKGQAAMDEGRLVDAAVLNRNGIQATRKLVADFPDAPLVKMVLEGKVKIGSYSYETITELLEPRTELWMKHESSFLARAFLEAQSISMRDERVEVFGSIAVAMAEARQAEAARIVIAAVREEMAALHDPGQIAYARMSQARALTTLGDSDAALTEVWAVLDELEDEPFVSTTLIGDILGELMDWCETINDNELALPILERIGEVATLAGPENDADFILEMVAFEMARRGDCMAAQFMSENLLTSGLDDPCGCDYEVDADASDERARLEILFDIFDECSEADPDSAAILLEDAIIDAQLLGWSEFMADIAWGFASLKQYDEAIEAARSIPDALSRLQAFLAIVEELPDDETDAGLAPLPLLHEAAATDLADAEARTRPRYRARLSVALAAHGDMPRAQEQAKLALKLAAALPVDVRGRVALELVLLSPRLSEKEKGRLVQMSLDETESNTILPAQLQGLRSAFDAWLAVGDVPRATKFLDRAVKLAKKATELGDQGFWCEAAVGYVAVQSFDKAGKLIDRLTPEAQHWCLVSLARSREHEKLDATLRTRIEAALSKKPAEPTPTDGATVPALLPCDQALTEGLKATTPGSDRVRYLLELAPRCERRESD
jgi:tetratricopeptide (TPR) repeat protein